MSRQVKFDFITAWRHSNHNQFAQLTGDFEGLLEKYGYSSGIKNNIHTTRKKR